MSGHSKWATIKRSKEATDKKKGAVMSRVSKDIINAVMIGGGGDVNFNPMLRVAINKAKSVNMTNDKIEKAINKGLGTSNDNEIIYEKTYEAYLPGGVPLLIDCETDNPNRTLTDIKTIVNKLGGKFLSEGAISWQFEEKGEISIKFEDTKTVDVIENELILLIMDIEGVLDYDISLEENLIRLYTEKQNLREVHAKVNSVILSGYSIESVKVVKISNSPVDASGVDENKIQQALDQIEEVSEVVETWLGI